jgi:hypothetical protein
LDVLTSTLYPLNADRAPRKAAEVAFVTVRFEFPSGNEDLGSVASSELTTGAALKISTRGTLSIVLASSTVQVSQRSKSCASSGIGERLSC